MREQSQSETTPRLAWPIADAAKAIGISVSQLRVEIGEGHLPIMRVGKRVLIPDEALRAFLSTRTVAAKAA